MRFAPCARRTAIVGVGAVGSTTAYAMLQTGTASELVLHDHDRLRAEGEYMDLQHCLPFTHHSAMSVRGADEIAGCGLVIVTAGAGQKPGESRLDLVKRNADIFASFFPLLSRNNPDAIFLIVTNPVDVMTRVALKLSGLPPQQVIGTGTVLDTARFRTLISQHCRILPRHVHAMVIGEHGDSEVMVWSRASIGAYRVAEYCDYLKIPLTTEDVERINNDVRNAAYQIIERKGATHFAIGVATNRIAEALGMNESSLYTVSRRCEGIFGL
ncbi:MAG TPA: L-lactate dehydrogenase, partial [Candidatus Hydrogenedentes bacterium]|nr:L-lactate dehydrogenase [Candidatus Hydrogenedentota bacterium]